MWGPPRGCRNRRLSSPVVHSGQIMVIFIHESIHELLDTTTGNAQFDDCGAQQNTWIPAMSRGASQLRIRRLAVNL